MRFTVRRLDNYVRGDLYGRETAEETKEFLQAVAQEALAAECDRVLISIHTSRAIFRVQQFGLADLFRLLASRPAHRVALVADSFEVRVAQQYIATLAKIEGLRVRSFASETDAVAWLQAQE